MRGLKVLLLLAPALLAAILVDAAVKTATGGARVLDPFLIIVIARASHGRKVESMAVGAVSGFVQDLLGSLVVGVHMLSKLVLGYAASLVSGRLIPGQPLTAIVLLGGGTIVDEMVVASTGFLLGQRFNLRTPTELLVSVVLNIVLGMLVLAALAAMPGRRRQVDMPAAVDPLFARRTSLLYWSVAVVIGLFVGRLYLLQVVRGERYKGHSEANSQKDRLIPAPRGLIVDREGRILVANRKSHDLMLDREAMDDPKQVASWVARVTGEDSSVILARIEGSTEPRYRPITLARDLAFSQVAYVESRREDVPGLFIETKILRQYPHGTLAAHVLGYVGEIDEKELTRTDLQHHRAGDLVGKGGVERSYDRLLAGFPGTLRSTVNNVGREIDSAVVQAPVPGADLHLTIDLDVQRACEAGLAGKRGACAVLDARDGSVIALASAPTFEPSAFVSGISQVRWQEYSKDPHHPLRFRAVAGTYPPGSSWKPLVSAAAIQSGAHRPGTEITCVGAVTVHGQVRHCWKEEGHGTLNMHQALVHSCNVYYYLAGRDMGWKPIHALGEQVGFGELTGIDIPGEVAGTLPGDDWKRRTQKERWYPGDTVNYSIGQGYLITTPLQIAEFALTIANGGTAYTPHVFEAAVDPATGDVVERAVIAAPRTVPYKPETLQFLRRAMEEVVSRGTGTRARVPGIRVAGKTGTAQPSSGDAPKGIPRAERAERYQEHAWFMGFAPVDSPQLAFAVVLEHAGEHGGTVAAPIAHDIVQAWFDDGTMVAGQ